MIKSGTATLPLHYGAAPRWLFEKMTRLSRELVLLIASEFGSEELLRRLANPYWFQALGCVLGFDWQSSGLTTTTCGALKEGIKGLEKELGLFICGGKGKTSRKTPQEIQAWGEKLGFEPTDLIKTSKLTAKVDNNLVQDGYQLYHHNFFFTAQGSWAVVQQGMNQVINRGVGWARRYHWFNPPRVQKDFLEEPQSAICTEKKGFCLDLTAQKSRGVRDKIVKLISEDPGELCGELGRIKKESGNNKSLSNQQLCIFESIHCGEGGKNLILPARHHILISDINPQRIHQVLLKTYHYQPKTFLNLIKTSGVGQKTLRALTLLAELIYGEEASYQDPARFSFAHGGKDGHPYPVSRKIYENSILFLHDTVAKAKIGRTEKIAALRRLSRIGDIDGESNLTRTGLALHCENN
jgi:hypothetical protein